MPARLHRDVRTPVGVCTDQCELLAARLRDLDRSYTLSTLSRIEQGKRRVDTDDLVALALALDVPPNAILFPPNEHYETRTKLTATIEADTAAVLRWAESGNADDLSKQDQAPAVPAQVPHGAVHRSILAVDVEGSIHRTNPEKGELRRIMYALLDRALRATGIGPKHLDREIDRGDGVLILIRPHDDVPKTLLLGQLMPRLAALLVEHNATVVQPTLRLRLRAVLHAGEIHDDGGGVYGEDLDFAFRLLDAPAVKRAFKDAPTSPLTLVVSEEINAGIVDPGYIKGRPYEQSFSVRVADRRRRGWVYLPTVLAQPEQTPGNSRSMRPSLSTSLTMTPKAPPDQDRAAG